jgi:hypothetical protein
MQAPWWARRLVCLLVLGVAAIALALGRVWIWVWAIGGVMTLVNLFLSWRDILDRLMPGR